MKKNTPAKKTTVAAKPTRPPAPAAKKLATKKIAATKVAAEIVTAKKMLPSASKAVPVKATKPVAKPIAKPATPLIAKPTQKQIKKLTAKPAAAGHQLRIFQIYYQPEQREQLEPTFEPYNNEGDRSPLLEFNVFQKLAKSELVQGADLWGALSWKFAQKTELSGASLRQTIADNPGYDVYYCNPYPELESQYHNLWLQGEVSHPDFLTLCQAFFEAADLDPAAINAFTPSQHFAASNYFVASPKFWRSYIEFVTSTIAKAEARLPDSAKDMLYSPSADRIGAHAGASYLPFIVERLFGLFLAEQGKTFKAFKYPLPAKEEALNVHLKLLRQMKDLAIKSKSLWLATCWVNYRNLYMSNNYGAQWCRRHLKNITPTDFKFLQS